MKNIFLFTFTAIIALSLFFVSCNQSKPGDETAMAEKKPNYGGFESQAKWGEHLVTICGCHDCHTPKKMTPMGPVLDSSLLLSGHPSQMPPPSVNGKEIVAKGALVGNLLLTCWTGPWGTSFTANLTPDPTGIGNWDEETFMRAIRMGKYKGIESGRSLLPPMPWEFLRLMTDDELKAIFAYLKTVKPINNVVPAPIPPASTPKQG